jgi:hypothetical protein
MSTMRTGVAAAVASVVGYVNRPYVPTYLFQNGEQGWWYDPSDVNLAWRRNLLTRTEEFDNSAWVKTNATVTANTTVAPDGTLTADKLIPNNGSAINTASASQIVSITLGTRYSFSCYVKPDGMSTVRLRATGSGTWAAAVVNLNTGSTSFVTGSVDVTLLNDGSARIVISGICDNTGLNTLWVYPYELGNGTDGVLVWGAQLEVGSLTTYQQIVTPEITYVQDVQPLPILYQDAAGTTPVTAVEQPCSLMLDKRLGLTLGSELVTNGDFATDTNWTKGTTWTIANGLATANGGSNFLQQSGFSWAVGKVYSVTYELSNVSAGYVEARLSTGTRGKQRASNGTFNEILAVTAATDNIFNIIPTGFVGSIDNVSVRELPGNHAYTPAAASTARPTVSARVNLLTKTEQFDNAAWTKLGATVTANTIAAPDGTLSADLLMETTTTGTHRVTQSLGTVSPATITASIRHKAGVGTRNLDFPIVVGSNFVSSVFSTATGAKLSDNDFVGSVFTNKQVSVSGPDIQGYYTATITVTVLTAGTASLICGLADGTNNSYTGDGTSGIFIWGADLRVANDGVGIPDYQRVDTATDYDTVGFPVYLRADGSNDFLQTNSIDFTGTDKMTICAGVRKLSDAAAGVVFELGTNVDSVNGSFGLLAPGTATNDIRWRSRGTTTVSATQTGISAPVTAILTGSSSISDDVAVLRNNTVQVASSTNDQGTGNYGNHVLNIFSRNQASSFFNGRFYGSVGRGAQSNAQQIAALEGYMNTKTAAY